jgi:hypothetical protein
MILEKKTSSTLLDTYKIVKHWELFALYDCIMGLFEWNLINWKHEKQLILLLS